MRQESTSGGEKQAREALELGPLPASGVAWLEPAPGDRPLPLRPASGKRFSRILRGARLWAGPVAVGAAGLAAAAGVGYLQGEKIGAAKAVAREVLVRDHRELREIQGGIELVRQKLYKIHAEERRAAEELRRAHEGYTNAIGAAPSQGASANAEQGAAPPISYPCDASEPAEAVDAAARKGPVASPPPSGPTNSSPGETR